MKIAIMGYSGSGKSTLARKLGEFYNCEVFHFDAIQFLPGWEIREYEEKMQMTKDFLDTHDSWVIDGTYSRFYLDRRFEDADLIVLMMFNRFSSLYRVTKRYLKYKNKTRPDMAEGCTEKLDWEFVKWVLRDGRKQKTRDLFQRIQTQYADKVVVIKNQKQLDKWSVKYENYDS